MKKLNHLRISGCLIILIVLLFSKSSFAQQGTAKTLVLDADRFNPAAVDIASYNVIVSKQFIARTDDTRFGDPSGQSAFRSLRVGDGTDNFGIFFDNSDLGQMVMDSDGIVGGYAINFDDLSGEARLGNLRATILTMDDSGPGDFRAEGKFVYDIAEVIAVEAGDVCDVVVISQDKDLTVTRSTVKFDAKVAGVISESPKICMGSIVTGSKPLALAGIVKCNVNTENGPIKRGDILVTSSQPGYAMRADEGQILPGMVVGSALDALEQGKGKIYILIN